MEFRTGYKSDEKLRKSLARLAEQTFGIDLETWYQNGFWQDDYIPYSMTEDDSVISNVSVNICNIRWKKKIRHLAQLGTVMTDSKYRGKGYASDLIKRASADCLKSFEGIYLYAEECNVPFYEKLGFKRIEEYQCRKQVNITNSTSAEKIPMDSGEDWDRMVDIIQRRGQYGDKIMVGNTGLFMFYLAGPFSDCVYYVPSAEAYVVAGVEGETLTVYAVFSDGRVSLGDIISSFGSGIKQVIMAFCPENNTGFELRKIESEESVLLARGELFENIGNERFMFPEISRA